MPRCHRCGQEKDIRQFETRQRSYGLYVSPRCRACREEERQDEPRLPAWPFKLWLECRIVHYAPLPKDSEHATRVTIPGFEELAARVAGAEVEPSSIQRWFHHIFNDNRSVKLDLVDRALLNEGSTMLWELVEMAEEHVLSNGYSFDQVLRRLEDLKDWKRWA